MPGELEAEFEVHRVRNRIPLNDATLAVASIRTFLGERHSMLNPEQRSAIVAYLGDRERELNRLRRSVGRAWRPVVGITFARRLARAVVVRPTA